MSETEPAISGLGFLVGRWRGEGLWRARPMVCRTAVELCLGRYLRMQVEARREGGDEHREHVIVHADGERLAALLIPGRGDVQRFEVQELAAGERYRLVFTPPPGSSLSPQRWTIERSATGYRERFEIAPGGGPFELSVECSYAAESDAA